LPPDKISPPSYEIQETISKSPEIYSLQIPQSKLVRPPLELSNSYNSPNQFQAKGGGKIKEGKKSKNIPILKYTIGYSFKYLLQEKMLPKI
jgi:hypothetical protein